MAKRAYRTKAVRLSSEIQAKIANGNYPAGAMLPPEVELGEHHDASRVTIRRALDMLAERGIVERIPHRGVMVKANPAAPAGSVELPMRGSASVRRAYFNGAPTSPAPVRRQRVVRLGTVIASRPDEGAIQIQEGIEEYVRQHDLSLQLVSSWDDCNEAFDALGEVEMLGIDGLLVLPYPGSDHGDILTELRQKGVPVVCVEKRNSELELSSVEPDNATGMYRTVNYLIQTYKLPVWFLGMGLGHKTDADRYDGYVCAMKDAGFAQQVDSHTLLHEIGSGDPRYWQEDRKWLHGYELGLRLFDRAAPPLSIACIKDDIASGVYKAAAERGIPLGRAPEQVHVTGFDNLTIAQLLEPPLTTVCQSMKDKGYQAAQLLHMHIGKGQSAPVTVRLPVKLIVRGSA